MERKCPEMRRSVSPRSGPISASSAHHQPEPRRLCGGLSWRCFYALCVLSAARLVLGPSIHPSIGPSWEEKKRKKRREKKKKKKCKLRHSFRVHFPASRPPTQLFCTAGRPYPDTQEGRAPAPFPGRMWMREKPPTTDRTKKK